MTILDCNVVNCMYNQDNCCKRQDIKVEGRNAHVSSDTCCGSFSPCEGEHCAKNASCNCKKDTEVACEATECMYNRASKCAAKHIGIAGGHADHRNETECGSFVCQ